MDLDLDLDFIFMLENARIERRPLSSELEVKAHKMMISENLSNNFAVRINGFKSRKLFGKFFTISFVLRTLK